MNKKSLLLLVPFAVAALTGCTPNKQEKPCSEVGVTFTDSEMTIGIGGTPTKIPFTTDYTGECTGDYNFVSNNPEVATVDGKGNVTGVKEGDAVITVNGGAQTFTVHVKAGVDPSIEEITPAKAIELMDAAGEGVVVEPEYIVVGVMAEKSYDSKNDEYYGKFEGSSVKISGAKYSGSETIDNGCTIKVKGYLEKYNGEYKIGYLPATVSPTGEKYTATIVSVSRPAGKEVKSVDGVKSAPSQVAVGEKVAASRVILNVTLEDDSTDTVAATKIELDTTKAAESVEGKAWYNNLGPVTFTTKVVAEAESSIREAYLAAEALKNDGKTQTEQFTFSGVVVGKRDNKNEKGEVEVFVQDGGYAVDVFNPTNKASLAVGNKVTVKAKLKNYNGTIETGDIESVTVDGNGSLPAETVIDSKATLEATKVSVLASMEGSIKSIPEYNKSADMKIVVTVASGDDVTLFFKKNFVESFKSVYQSLAVGDHISVNNAVVGDFKGRQVLVIDGTQITKGETPDPGEPAINLDKYSATIAKDGEVTLTATVYNSEESVSWSIDSGEGNVAITPNGKTCVVKGVVANSSAVVKATLGTTGKSKTCNVTVKADSPVIEGIVLNFAELSEVSGTVEGVSYASNKASGASAPAYNSSNKELRLYAKNTFTISGTNITKITFDYNGCYTEGEKDPCHKATGDIVSASVGSVSAGVWTGSADSVTFTMSDSGQVHVHKVGVVCAAAKTVSVLTVKTQPNKVAYNEGESFSAAGLVLHAVYSDSSEEDITSGWTISPASALAPTDNKVVVSYGGKSVDVNITVTARELLSIAITSGMSDKEYVVGENWDAAGVVVTGTYNIGEPTVIDSSKYNLTFSPEAPALGVTSVSIVASMKDGSKTSEAYVQNDISVAEAPADPVVGQTFTKISSTTDLADGVYMLVYEDATSPKVSDGGEGPVDATIEENSIVGVKGQGAFEIKAMTGGYSIKSLSGEKAGKYLSGTSGSNGTNFGDDPVANEITITDGVADIVSNTSHLRYNFGAGMFRYYKASSYSSQGSVALYKQGAPVEPAVLTGIEVSNSHRSFYLGDPFVKETVTASYDKGEPKDVTDSAVFSEVNMNQSGKQTVNVSYTEGEVTKDTSYTITIDTQPAPHVDVKGVSLDKEALTLDEGATATLVATVAPSDATVKTVSWESSDISVATVANGVVTAVKKGTATITVTTTEGGKTAACSVTVNEKTAEKGTKDNPYTASEALEATQALTDPYWSDARYYVTGKVKSFDSNSTNKCTITDGTNDFLIYKSDVKGNTVNIGDIATFEGFLKNHNGSNPQMTSQNDGTHNALPTLVSIKAPTVVALGTITAPASVPKDGELALDKVDIAVTYDDGTSGVEHPDRIELDTSTIKESVTGTAYIGELHGEFTIAVIDAPVEKTQTIAYSGGTTNMDGTNQASLLGVTDTCISVVGTLNSGQNNVGLNKAGQIRLYANSSTTLTISITGGTISFIDIKLGGTVNGLNVNGSNVSASSNETVNVAVDGTSAAINNNAASGQTYILSIVVHYTMNK